MSQLFTRRDVLLGGATLGGGALISAQTHAVLMSRGLIGRYAQLRPNYLQALNRVLARWWDPVGGMIRPTNGGAIQARNGLADITVSAPSFWQMECLENVLFNDSKLDPDRGSRNRLTAQWRFLSLGVPAFTSKVLAGDGRNLTINTSDDAAWQCWYLMHAHISTGDARALTYLAEATAFTRRRFTDRDHENNPSEMLGVTPSGQPITSSRYGILYAVETEPAFAIFGKVSTCYEAILALTELYVYSRIGIQAYRECAIRSFRWIKDKLRTAESTSSTIRQPATLRKAEGLYETELCLARDGGTPGDRRAKLLTPVNAFWGKPIRSLDSTYINGAMAMALLATRLAFLPETGREDRTALLDEAVHISNTLPKLNAYGRDVNGKRLIANTRDPWSDAQVAFAFVRECLALPGVEAGVPLAFVETAVHILENAQATDGRLTADWAGPELNFTTGRSTWEADYATHPGQQAGAAQIMTEGQSLAMVQSGLAATTLLK